MDPELDAILSADEESRARLQQAETAARLRLEAARVERDQRRRERYAAALHSLEDAVTSILEQADREIAERRHRRLLYMETRRLAAEKAFARAVETYVRIVREGAAGAKR
jgi:hypothetical protein